MPIQQCHNKNIYSLTMALYPGKYSLAVCLTLLHVWSGILSDLALAITDSDLSRNPGTILSQKVQRLPLIFCFILGSFPSIFKNLQSGPSNTGQLGLSSSSSLGSPYLTKFDQYFIMFVLSSLSSPLWLLPRDCNGWPRT